MHLLGRSLITVSVLMVLFVTYQLWGTGLITAREQASLKSEFAERLALRDTAGEAPGGRDADGAGGRSRPRDDADSGPSVEPERGVLGELPERLETGEVAGLLAIPEIGAEHAFVEGIGVGDLRRGPGHYPQTPMPGDAGNAAVAGHRTTYGSPFNRLDELEAGDEIHVTTLDGEFTYVVEGSDVVGPRDVEVLEPDGADTLTLTTCHPEYSSRERLIVRASLVGEPLDAAASPDGLTSGSPAPGDDDAGEPSGSLDAAHPVATLDSLDGGHDSGWGALDRATAGTAVLAAGVGAAWWWAFRRRRSPWTWLAGLPPFLLALLVFFVQLEAVLPASY